MQRRAGRMPMRRALPRGKQPSRSSASGTGHTLLMKQHSTAGGAYAKGMPARPTVPLAEHPPLRPVRQQRIRARPAPPARSVQRRTASGRPA
eukprot:11355312-Heterocapsa_arctica.AAC.1